MWTCSAVSLCDLGPRCSARPAPATCVGRGYNLLRDPQGSRKPFPREQGHWGKEKWNNILWLAAIHLGSQGWHDAFLTFSSCFFFFFLSCPGAAWLGEAHFMASKSRHGCWSCRSGLVTTASLLTRTCRVKESQKCCGCSSATWGRVFCFIFIDKMTSQK